MWPPESPQNCYNPHEMEELETPKDPLQEETQMKDDPSGGDPSGKTRQKEADPLKEDHPSKEDYPLV